MAIAKLQLKYGDNMLRVLTGTSGIRHDDMLQTQILGWRIDNSGLDCRNPSPSSRNTG